MIIINSYPVAQALFEQKGANYSDRPVLSMLGELGGWNQVTPFVGINPEGRMRFHRRFMQQIIGTRQNMERFHLLQEEEMRRLLRRIYNQPRYSALQGHVAQCVLARHYYFRDDQISAVASPEPSFYASLMGTTCRKITTR